MTYTSEQRRKYDREYRERNRDHLNALRRTPKIRMRLARYYRLRRAGNENFRLAGALRARLRSAMRASGARKSRATMVLVGCDLPALKRHLENQFVAGMAWQNYGGSSANGWGVDHVRPCASFDLKIPEQQKTCFHYTNLQPLWNLDNRKKGCLV